MCSKMNKKQLYSHCKSQEEEIQRLLSKLEKSSGEWASIMLTATQKLEGKISELEDENEALDDKLEELKNRIKLLLNGLDSSDDDVDSKMEDGFDSDKMDRVLSDGLNWSFDKPEHTHYRAIYVYVEQDETT